MDKTLFEYLKNNKIEYKTHEHPAFFSVEESKKFFPNKAFFHTKSLFLKDENNNFYLVCMNANKKLNIKALKAKLNLKELHFASPEELKKELNLTPGSVSIFGMIYSKNTFLLIDKELWDAKQVGFHPNINTATLEISHKELEKFYNSLKCKKEVTSLE